MLDIFAKYAVDLRAETDGVWRNVGDASFLIARSGNEKFTKAFTEAYKANEEAIAKGDEEADRVAREMMANIFADTLILDWKNVGYKGKKLPYSKANVVMLLSQPELRDFQKALIGMAEDAEAFRLKLEEEQAKN